MDLSDGIIADTEVLPCTPGQEDPELTGHNRSQRNVPEPCDLTAELDSELPDGTDTRMAPFYPDKDNPLADEQDKIET